MIREVVKIDEDKCDGCGLCVPGCHEGALQIIDGKARLISDLLCDGLGACIGHCPQEAITIEKREAEPYNETKVMALMAQKGKNTVVAHLKHLKDHNERDYLKEGIAYIIDHENELDFTLEDIRNALHAKDNNGHGHAHGGGGCPGSQARSLTPKAESIVMDSRQNVPASALAQWPVQLHLISPNASYFRQSDLLIAADCVAYALGNFHSQYLAGKSLAIACPKLDSNQEVYAQKIMALIDQAMINTLQVMIMQVPCCGGLLQLVKSAAEQAQRKVPVKLTVVGLEGEILKEEWI
ncbi:MAG: 4Fe-4S ferredoxin [Bacteroidetes bacterium]|jgi:ferredoxin|nr:4Fe-4S ferredoxin [Bacteroidota bacterium]